MKNDWLKEYEGLTKFKKDKLYSVVGPFIMGLELVKLPRVEKYRPHFVIYSLYGLPSGTSLKDCLSYPVVNFEFFNSKNLQFSLRNDENIYEAKEALDKFLSFGLGTDVPVQRFLSWLEEVCENANLKFRVKMPEIWEVMYNAALYFSEEMGNQVLNEIKKNIENVDKEKCFKNYGGFSRWMADLTVRNREEQITILNKNKSSKEIKSLNFFEIN